MMALLISVMMSVALYTVVYYLVMPRDLQTKDLAFFISTQVDTSLNQKDQTVTTIPSLKSLVPIGNPKVGLQAFNQYQEIELTMDDEYFTIEVEFTAQETQANMEKGSIYLQSKFTSYKQSQQPLVFHRMGLMQMKSSFFVYLKEFIRSLPLIGYLCNCEPS
jgi:Putative adipose-regulatory protein (Seipin)